MKKATVSLVAIFALLLSACVWNGAGIPQEHEGDCSDGIDGDNDGFIDCDDFEDCGLDPACLPSDCGNETLDGTEVCDSGHGCLEDCTCPEEMDPNGSGGCIDPALCGDGEVNPGEDCDDEGESADCDADCTFSSCGDSTLNETAGEFCDSGGDTAECDSDCSIPDCGDGHLNTAAGEVCDDSGESATCNDDCTTPSCGDSNVNQAAGEDCDTGGESAICDNDCSTPACGDGNLNVTAGEICDDSNTDSSDGCSADCLSDETCGNGITDTSEGEVCDDSNNLNGDGCSANCLSNETCGNGTFDTTEICDGGTDCLLTCLCPEGKASDGSGGCQIDAATCGDGIDNDLDGDTDCDDEKCGVIRIALNQGGSVYVVTAVDSQSQAVSPGGFVTIDINAADEWARIYTYARIVDASNDHGFLYWQPGVPQPAPFGTPGTPATTHFYNYGDSEWTNYSLTCL
jgi:cysteine-rich repeat protein